MQKRKTLNIFGQNAKKSLAIKKKAEEEKKQKEAEEEARVYEEFVAAFEDDDTASKEFVKAGTSVDGKLFSANSKNSIYKPNPKVSFEANSSLLGPISNPLQSTPKPDSTTPTSMPPSSKKRNLDLFLEEIKKGQGEREERLKTKKNVAHLDPNTNLPTKGLTLMAAFEDNPGSHELGDESTTNIYVGNLNPSVNEEMLLQKFGKYGSIGSVKIMWPRKQEEIDRARNSGFVCFMDRASAAEALKEMDGLNLMGYELRLCWGKAVPIPPKPIYVPGGDSLKNDTLSGLPFNAKLPPKARGGYSGTMLAPDQIDTDSQIPEIRVAQPSDAKTLKLIHRVCEYVIRFGPKFEDMLMIKEHGSERYKFLFENETAEHIYYRWKLFSLLNGDPIDSWRTEMFYMFSEGPIWIPPELPLEKKKIAELSDSSQEEEDEKEKSKALKASLGTIALNRLYKRLKELNTNRGSIARAMVFVIEHAEAADQVSQIICEFSYNESLPHPLLLARLFLISDILHNCSASVFNAWKFRQSLEKYLPGMFDVLKSTFRQIDARLKAEQFRKNILSVLAVWEAWLIFSKDFLGLLASGLL